MTRRGLLFVCLALVLVGIGLYAANTLTVPDWWRRLRPSEAAGAQWSSPIATGYPAIGWMDVHQVEDFASITDLLVFLRDMQIPVPPLLGTADVISHLYLGSVKPITVGLYQFSLIGGFLLALFLCRRSSLSMILSFLLSATFLTGAIEIHRLNPQIYDVVCPFLLLLFIVTLDLFPSAGRLRTRRLCAALCGLSLTMAELTRPFMVFVVPFLVLSAVGVMRGKRCLPYFFVPLLLLSGSWHAQVAIRYQRLAWTNHTGFNLLHAWPMVHRPQLVPELHSTPLARGRRLNLNTDEHSENSRRLARAVLAYVVAHPAHATLHGLERIYDLLYRVVPFFGAVGSVEPNYPIYRGLVRACALWWLLNLAAFVSSVLLPRASGRASPAWATSTGALIMAMSGSIFFLAIGDHGEEYRFLISILPLFAALPECRPWRFPIAAALDSAPSPNGRREAQG